MVSFGLGLGTSSAATFRGNRVCHEAATLFAAMSSWPSQARQALIDTCIGALKAADIWTKLDVLYVLAAADSQAARLNWKKPSAFALVNVGAGPTFVADRGATSDGSSTALTTQYTPSTQGVNFIQDNASIWSWVTTAVQDANRAVGNHDVGAVQANVIGRNASDLVQVTLNDATASTAGANTTAGMFGASRAAGATLKAWKNGAQSGSDISVSSTGVADGAQWVAGGNAISHSSNQVAFAAWGSSLTGKEAAFYAAVLAYMQGVGAA